MNDEQALLEDDFSEELEDMLQLAETPLTEEELLDLQLDKVEADRIEHGLIV